MRHLKLDRAGHKIFSHTVQICFCFENYMQNLILFGNNLLHRGEADLHTAYDTQHESR